ncbi:bifunctional adenosylcobinamide kinase/adenosylcobinamide-phosphate guanylyltransferase [Paenibacillus sp. ACRRX]|uniref:bifunctional adenosylcobinamide kinase/adenosylcobinamide-phosphate guanylyltransferase n=1 Tax=unclassified Paenibacillus TaxID=185978 RepID=UPI001EF62D7B|nr:MULTISPECIES: bifunctional adenosylcobinamide kinase/adenosylcobinamide-phosphate guanylyltransferase [unclassified Paenibacillus]MCG7409975.1 bifunctional adenosylcobinamide kinase/adenosylcobinamide-phosphate guanylyltransferase [Paenibacillus sp. ACRRX]MDK8182960.1 bifunctional adenosylcobinamide kinase/adenosylcobinamide-phosphate guanylyltransferase [Paenibacillus sp. UMB4589-SE434]
MSGRIVLVTGGARSGKSSFAERYVMKHSPQGSTYVATAEAYDDEMRERIRLHQQQRVEANYKWSIAESPRGLPAWINAAAEPAVLVDCLTIWLSNELLAVEQHPRVEQLVDDCITQIVEAAAGFDGMLVCVTNEVGSGVVPAYKLGRTFRDAAGRLNQRMAALADEVYLVTAGIPVEIKRLRVDL